MNDDNAGSVCSLVLIARICVERVLTRHGLASRAVSGRRRNG